MGVMGAMGLMAQQSPKTVAQQGFSNCSTNPQTTLSYAIVSANAANGGAPIVTFLNAGTDLVTGRVQFYRVDALTSVTYTNSTVTLPVVQTNNLADGGVIVIRHVLDDSYEKRTLTTSTGSTNLVVTVAPLGTTIPGDLIYHVTTTGAGCIRWGATTNSLSLPRNIYSGQAGYPLLLEINGTSTAELNLVSGYYQ